MDLQPVHLVRRSGVGQAAADARAELARRWLSAFGPALMSDLQWWTGLTGGQVRQALAQLELAKVDLHGAPGVMLAADLPGLDAPAPQPWAALLPALDPTAMGWRERDWYVGEHAAALFDRSGNIGPTAWWDGRIVGGWAQRGDGEIAVRLLNASPVIDRRGRGAGCRGRYRRARWYDPVARQPFSCIFARKSQHGKQRILGGAHVDVISLIWSPACKTSGRFVTASVTKSSKRDLFNFGRCLVRLSRWG